jgi:hypothetical protein
VPEAYAAALPMTAPISAPAGVPGSPYYFLGEAAALRQHTRHRQHRSRTITSSPTPSNCRARPPCAACSMNSPANARCRRQRRHASARPRRLLLPRSAGVGPAGRCRIALPGLRRAGGTPRLPHPRRARQWQAAGLVRQCRDDAKAAGGHRSTGAVLPARELQHPPCRPRTGGPLDGCLRGRAQQGGALHRRGFRRGDHLRARRHRGHQPGRQDLGQAEHPRRRRDHRLQLLEHHANIVPGSSSPPPKRAPRIKVIPVDDKGQLSAR